MFKYTQEEIDAMLYSRGQRKVFTEAEDDTFSKEKKPQESADDTKPIEETKYFKKFKVGDDRVDVDTLHGFLYINDELVTEDTEVPKKVISLFQAIIPKLAKTEAQEEQ